MNFWRINTDSSARKDVRTCDLWYEHGAVFTGDFAGRELKHAMVLRKMSRGDRVFMHHSGLGLVGYGKVMENWDGKVYRDAERLLYEDEVTEYRIKVDWDPTCDTRKNPLPIQGLMPYMGTYKEVDPEKSDIHRIVKEMRERAKIK